ncbi:MAG: urate hydroxylase PuuD, partial [Rickettsiales bacterium]
TQPQAIFVGILSIAGGWLFYNTLCQTELGKHNGLFGLVWFMALTAAAYGLTQVFSDRGAYIHVGAIIGTVMAANVFAIIIPNQKKVVASLLKGEKPDARLGLMAKQRSLHNNYMTLPVLFIMVSNHYPMTFSHHMNWLILAWLGVVAWFIRHFFNLKHKGIVNYAYPAIGVAGFIGLMVFAAYKPGVPQAAAEMTVSDAEVKQIIRTHCAACHSDAPTHPDWPEAPQGVLLDTMAEVKTHAVRIKAQAVDADIMPLGNETGMTDEERAKLGAWIDGVKD